MPSKLLDRKDRRGKLRTAVQGCRVSNANPRAHFEVGKKGIPRPMANAVEVEYNELVGPTIETHPERRTGWDRSEDRFYRVDDGGGTRVILFPYIEEPATGSRIPSMSTGGGSDESDNEADRCSEGVDG